MNRRVRQVYRLLLPPGSGRVILACGLILVILYLVGSHVVGGTGIGVIVAALVVSISGAIASVLTGLVQGRYLAMEDLIQVGQRVELLSLSPLYTGTVEDILPRVLVIRNDDGALSLIPHTLVFLTVIRIQPGTTGGSLHARLSQSTYPSGSALDALPHSAIPGCSIGSSSGPTDPTGI